MESSRFGGHDDRCARWLQRRIEWCLRYVVGTRDDDCFASDNRARLIIDDDLAEYYLNGRSLYSDHNDHPDDNDAGDA